MRQRRNFSAESKAKVVLEIISGAKCAAEICRERNLKSDLLPHWKSWRNWQAGKAWRLNS
jgi:transposase-like protein